MTLPEIHNDPHEMPLTGFWRWYDRRMSSGWQSRNRDSIPHCTVLEPDYHLINQRGAQHQAHENKGPASDPVEPHRALRVMFQTLSRFVEVFGDRATRSGFERSLLSTVFAWGRSCVGYCRFLFWNALKSTDRIVSRPTYLSATCLQTSANESFGEKIQRLVLLLLLIVAFDRLNAFLVAIVSGQATQLPPSLLKFFEEKRCATFA